ncbi:MAG: beta-N-acetylhexosaminidase [SAR324 cluster bacterium]|nr:beta-N-acetylhexosaminidase [SAR324 cluster bacterium]
MRLFTQTAEDGVIAARFVYKGKSEITDFRICFSLLSTCSAVSGCRIDHQLGGYTELIPDSPILLNDGQEWGFSFKYEFERHAPLNVSWGPAGAFLKLKNGQAVDVLSEPLKFLYTPSLPVKQQSPVEPELRLIPHPVLWEKETATCDLSNGFCLPQTPPAEIQKVIKAFSSLINRYAFKEILSSAGVTIHFDNLHQKVKDDAYEMEIKAESVSIKASGYNGFFYSLISLFQLVENYDGLVPCGKIEDSPRFSWRGQHLDCARHYYQVDSILRLLDLMSFLKLNRFHWHLIDDEAFRLELSSVPELADRTGMRGHGCTIPGVFGGSKGPTGGTYSAEDVSRIIEHASSLGISVMPEIEIPAHSLALLKVIPEMRDPEDKSFEVSVQGYCENTINPAMPATWNFLKKVLPEISALFPFGLIHLGCDELPPKIWEKSPAINKLKTEKDLETTMDVQEWTMQRAAKILVEAGVRPAAWEEAASGVNGGIANDTLLFSWSGQEPGLKAARAGYEVVMCPAQHVYFDMAQSENPLDRGVCWAAIVSMKDALDWDPVPLAEPELEQKIIGIQGALWSETIIKDRDMDTMLVPRILALSEVSWSTAKRKRGLSEFMGTVNYFSGVLNQLGWESYHLN